MIDYYEATEAEFEEAHRAAYRIARDALSPLYTSKEQLGDNQIIRLVVRAFKDVREHADFERRRIATNRNAKSTSLSIDVPGIVCTAFEDRLTPSVSAEIAAPVSVAGSELMAFVKAIQYLSALSAAECALDEDAGDLEGSRSGGVGTVLIEHLGK